MQKRHVSFPDAQFLFSNDKIIYDIHYFYNFLTRVFYSMIAHCIYIKYHICTVTAF